MEVNSMTMQFSVNNQTLTKTSSEKVVEHSVSYLYAQFTFNANWNEVDKKYLIVKSDDLGANRILLDNENKGLIPSVYVTYGTLVLAVVGVDEHENVVITTNPSYVPIYKTIIPYGEDPFLKYIQSDTLDVVQSGDRVDIEIPNIYFKDANLTNDILNLLGRDNTLLKSIEMPYGKIHDITIAIDNTTYVFTLNAYDKDNTLLFTRTADFNIEGMLIESASYDSDTQELVLVFHNGDTVRIPISDILTGIATQDWVNTNFYNKSYIDTNKQDTLVNQENIKSINGISVLGSGNIDTKNVGYVELDLSDLVDDTLNLTDAQIAEMQKEYAIIKVENEYYKKEFDATNDDNKLIFLYEFYFTTLLNSGIRESHVKYIVVDLIEKTATLMDEEAFSVYEKGKTDELLATKQNVIDSSHKLDADLVDDTNATHKFVSASEKAQITTNANDITSIKDGQSIDSFSDVETALGNIQNGTTINNFSGVESALSGKQDTLSGSTSIDITSNVVSVKDSYVNNFFATSEEIDTMLEEVFG